MLVNDVTMKKKKIETWTEEEFVIVLSFMAPLPGPGAASTAAPPRHAPRLPVPEAELGLASVRCPAHQVQGGAEQDGQGEEGEVLHTGQQVTEVIVKQLLTALCLMVTLG